MGVQLPSAQVRFIWRFTAASGQHTMEYTEERSEWRLVPPAPGEALGCREDGQTKGGSHESQSDCYCVAGFGARHLYLCAPIDGAARHAAWPAAAARGVPVAGWSVSGGPSNVGGG